MVAPVRSAIVALESVIDRVLCVIGAVLFSQFPEFVQQYLQRLGGHLDEARLQLAKFKEAAEQTGVTLDQLIKNASSNPNPSLARLGGVIQETEQRVQALTAANAAIRDASPWARPFVFFEKADPQIAKATWAIFRPAVPTTLEGMVYAAAGIVVILSLYHGCVRYPIRQAWRRRQAPPVDPYPRSTTV